MIVRPLRPEDAAHVDALWHGAIAPFAGAAPVLEVAKSLPMRAFVAEDDAGAIAGYASVLLRPAWQSTHAPFRVRVASGERGRGIGRALWQVLAAEGWDGPLVTHVDSADSAARATAQRHGGLERGLHLVSILDLASVPDGVPAAPDARATIRVPDLDDSEERDRVYDLLIRRAEDAPDVGPGNVLIPHAQFDAWFAESWQVLVLQIDGVDAGLTAATATGTEAHITFTGVDASARGRGLATWLKRRHAVELRHRGFQTLRTENMSTNEPILAVNTRAGFRHVGGFFDVVFPGFA